MVFSFAVVVTDKELDQIIMFLQGQPNEVSVKVIRDMKVDIEFFFLFFLFYSYPLASLRLMA